MKSIQAFPQARPFALPVARVRSVCRVADVERKLDKLQGRESCEHDSLRSTYQSRLKRGPERFQMKPSSIPEMAPLYSALPDFSDVLDDVRRHVAPSHDSANGREVTPMLLLGQPGPAAGQWLAVQRGRQGPPRLHAVGRQLLAQDSLGAMAAAIWLRR